LPDGLLGVIETYGRVEEINCRADETGRLENRLTRLREEHSPYLADLAERRVAGAFVTLPEYRRSVLGPAADSTAFDEEHAVTLEVNDKTDRKLSHAAGPVQSTLALCSGHMIGDSALNHDGVANGGEGGIRTPEAPRDA